MQLFKFKFLSKTISLVLIFVILQTSNFISYGIANSNYDQESLAKNCISPKSYFENIIPADSKYMFSLTEKNIAVKNLNIPLSKVSLMSKISDSFFNVIYAVKRFFVNFFTKTSLNKFLLTVLFSFFIAVSNGSAQDFDFREINNFQSYSIAHTYRQNILNDIELTGVASEKTIENILNEVRSNLDESIQKEAIKILSENHCIDALNIIVYSDLYSVTAREDAFFYLKKNNGVYVVIDFINKYLSVDQLSANDSLLFTKRLLDLQDVLLDGDNLNLAGLPAFKKVSFGNALFVLYESSIIGDVLKNRISNMIFTMISDPVEIAKFVAAYTSHTLSDKSCLILSEKDMKLSFNQHHNMEFRDAALTYLQSLTATQLLGDLANKAVPDNFLMRFLFDENRIRYASFLNASAQEGIYNERWTMALLPDIASTIEKRTDMFIKDASNYLFGQSFYEVSISHEILLSDISGVNSQIQQRRNESLTKIISYNQKGLLAYLAVNSSFADVRIKALNALYSNVFYLLQIHANTQYQDSRNLSSQMLATIRESSFQSSSILIDSDVNLSYYIVPLIKNVSTKEDKELLLAQYVKTFSEPFTLLEFYNVVDKLSDLSEEDRTLIKSFVENEVKRLLALSILKEKIMDYQQKHLSSLFASKDEDIMTVENLISLLNKESLLSIDVCLDKLPKIKQKVNQLFEDLSHLSVQNKSNVSFLGSIKKSMLNKFLLLFGVSFSILLIPFFLGKLLKNKFRQSLINKKEKEEKFPIVSTPFEEIETTLDDAGININDLSNINNLNKLLEILDGNIYIDMAKENEILEKLAKIVSVENNREILIKAQAIYKKMIFRIYKRKLDAKSELKESSKQTEIAKDNHNQEQIKEKSKIREVLSQLKNIFSGEGFLSEKMLKQLSLHEGSKFNISSDFVSLRKKIKFSAYLLSFAQYGLVIIPFFLSMFFVVPTFLNVVLIGFLVFFVGAELFNQWLLQKVEVKDKSLGTVIRKLGLDFKISRANLPSSWHIVTGELSRWYIFQLALTIFSITAALFFVKTIFVPFFIGLVFISAVVVFFSVFSNKGILKKQDAFLNDYQKSLNVLEDNVALGIDYDFDEVITDMQKSSKLFRGESIKFSFRLFLLIKIGIPLIGVFLGFPLQGYLLSTYLYSFFGTNYFIRSVFESLFHVKMLKKLLDKIDTLKNITKAKWDMDIKNNRRQNYFEEGWHIDSLRLEKFSVPMPNSSKDYIIRNQTISFDRGELVRISAASGAGKSTLAKIIASVWDNKAGKGSKVIKLKNAKGIEKWVPCTPDYFNLSDIRKRIKYIDMSDFPSGSTVSALLERFHIDQKSFFDTLDMIIPDLKSFPQEILSKNLFEFSHGERLRLELILVLLYYQDKDISHLVLDEPFANLDKKSIKIVFAYLKKWQKELAKKDISGKAPAVLIIDHNLPSDAKGIDKNISFTNGAFVEETHYKLQERIFAKTIDLLQTSSGDILNYQTFIDKLDSTFLSQYNEILGIPQLKKKEETSVIAQQQKGDAVFSQDSLFEYKSVRDYLNNSKVIFSEENKNLLLSYSIEDFKLNLELCEKNRLPLTQANMAIWQQKCLFSEEMVLGFSLRSAINKLLDIGGITASNMMANKDWFFFNSLFKIDSDKFMTALNFASNNSQLVSRTVAQMVLLSNKINSEKMEKKNSSKEKSISDNQKNKVVPESKKRNKRNKIWFKILPLFFVTLFSLTHTNLFLDIAKKIQHSFYNSNNLMTDPAEIFKDYGIWNRIYTNGNFFVEQTSISSNYIENVFARVQNFSSDIIYSGETGVLNYLLPENTYVRVGDVIARYSNEEQDRLMHLLNVETRNLSVLQLKLIQDEALLENNYIALEDVKNLRREVSSSQNKVNLLQAQLARFVIRAYAEGKLEYSNDFLRRGYSFSEREALFRILSADKKIISFNMPSYNASFFEEGMDIILQVEEAEIVGKISEISGDLTLHNKDLTLSVIIPETAVSLTDGQQYEISVKVSDAQISNPIVFPFNKYYSLSGFIFPKENRARNVTATTTGTLNYVYDNNLLVGVSISDPLMNIRIIESIQVRDRLQEVWEINQDLHDNTGGISANDLIASHVAYLNACDNYNSLVEIRNSRYIPVNREWVLNSNLPPEGKYVTEGDVIFSYVQNNSFSAATAFVPKEDISILGEGDSAFIYVEGHNLVKATLVETGIEENGYVPFVFEFEQKAFHFPQGLPVHILVPKNSGSIEDAIMLNLYENTSVRYGSSDIFDISA